MNRISFFSGLLAVCLTLAACVSVVKVEKYTGREDGIRYALPAMYVLVTPKADGTASYDWIALPDPNNQYVVRSKSILSKYTLDLTLENGLLKKVSAKADSGAVPSKALDAAQSVYAARVGAAAEAAKKQGDKTAAAQKALADAQLELDQVQAEFDAIQKPPLRATEAQIFDVTVRLAKAKAKCETAKKAASGGLSSMNAPGAPQEATGAWGPILFRVVETEDDVRLVAVNVQSRFDTTAVADTTSSPKQSFLLKGAAIFEYDSKKPLTFEVEAAVPVVTVEPKAILYKGTVPYTESEATLTLIAGNKTVVVHVKPFPPPGTYTLPLPYSDAPARPAKADATITFEVR